MYGIILTGHGNFASGLKSACTLLMGETDNLKAVDFLSEHSTDDLSDNLKSAFDALKGSEQIFVLCDIIGGSPFNVSVTLSAVMENVRVFYGANLPMAVELINRNMMNEKIPDAVAAADSLIDAGKAMIGRFVMANNIEESF